MKLIKKSAFLILIILTIQANAQVYKSNTGHASFFSEGTVKDIDAHNEKVKAELNTSTGEIVFIMNMHDFQFKNRKMEKDARRKHLETDKYQEATFRGKINNQIDYAKIGVYPATASGKLKIHGVEKEVTEKGTVTVKEGVITLQSDFNILLKDYNIETPKLAFKEMTADNMSVKVNVMLAEQKKNIASKKKKIKQNL